MWSKWQAAKVEEAREFAAYYHGKAGQLRKYTGEPYIAHPAEVVDVLQRVPHTWEMVAAAWLHDVVEDTEVTLEMIKERFGSRVAALVAMVTKVSKPSDGNRAERKAIDNAHLAGADAEGQTLKLADIISNIDTIQYRDPEFAKFYLPEKRLQLEVLKDGHINLWARADDIICGCCEVPGIA